mmetsp:Transcript_21192/g.25007  ORF Transcript_21192/g.25007 Transcript_21192/m.25007 type:complete len:133 (+) Transcript_21192:3-401(+)
MRLLCRFATMCSLEQTIPEDEDFLPTTVPTLLKNEEDDYTPPTRSWDITPLNEEVRATLAEVQQHKAGNAEGDDQQPTVSWELAAEVQETLERVKQRSKDRPRRKSWTLLHEDPAIQDAMKFITASQELQAK